MPSDPGTTRYKVIKMSPRNPPHRWLLSVLAAIALALVILSSIRDPHTRAIGAMPSSSLLAESRVKRASPNCSVIVNFGIQKSGTTSLAGFMTKKGLLVTDYSGLFHEANRLDAMSDLSAFLAWEGNVPQDNIVLKSLNTYNFFSDAPYNLLYPILTRPDFFGSDACYILTTRKPDTWLASIERQMGDVKSPHALPSALPQGANKFSTGPIRRYMYGLVGFDRSMLTVYVRFHDQIRDFFRKARIPLHEIPLEWSDQKRCRVISAIAGFDDDCDQPGIYPALNVKDPAKKDIPT